MSNRHEMHRFHRSKRIGIPDDMVPFIMSIPEYQKGDIKGTCARIVSLSEKVGDFKHKTLSIMFNGWKQEDYSNLLVMMCEIIKLEAIDNPLVRTFNYKNVLTIILNNKYDDKLSIIEKFKEIEEHIHNANFEDARKITKNLLNIFNVLLVELFSFDATMVRAEIMANTCHDDD